MVQAALPGRPIDKGRPGLELLAHVITSKYADHLPLYRLERIFPRYGIERSAKKKGLDDDACRQLRQERARPILQRIGDYLSEIVVSTPPKSPLGDAIGHTLRQWDARCRYTEDGSLAIDNNAAERALRPLCLGRKNWLFINSEAAIRRTMVLLTLVQTCKAHQVDPFACLRDVIDRVSTHPMSHIGEVAPR
ncbi:MAG: transposase, partial [Acidobacteriota bacterium]